MLFGSYDPNAGRRATEFAKVRRAARLSLERDSTGEKIEGTGAEGRGNIQVRAYEPVGAHGFVVAEVTDVNFHLNALETDAKTKLATPFGFERKLTRYRDRAREEGRELVGWLFFMDMDYFHYLNATFGYDIADEVLREVAERIESSTRPADLIGSRSNQAGDEFVVFCDGIATEAEARAMRDRFEAGLRGPYLKGKVESVVTKDGSRVPVSVSVGCASWAVAQSLEEPIRQAVNDHRQYKKGTHTVFGDSR